MPNKTVDLERKRLKQTRLRVSLNLAEVTASASDKRESLKGESVKTWQPSLFITNPYLASSQSQEVINSPASDVVDGKELINLENGCLETVSPSSEAFSSLSENQNLLASPSITTDEVTEDIESSEPSKDSLDSKTPSLHDLRDWYRVAGSLGKSQEYCDRIVEVDGELVMGKSFSERAMAAMKGDFSAYQATLNSLREWERAARDLGKSDKYLERIVTVTREFEAGTPLSDRAKATMGEDVALFNERRDRVLLCDRKPEISLDV